MRFRRAEGVAIVVRPCRGLDVVDAIAARQKGETRTMLRRQHLRLLGRLGRWSTAAELDVAPERLQGLAERDLLFYTNQESARHLGGAPLDALEGKVALRGNVHAVPVVAIADRFGPFPEMLRRGGPPVAVAGAALVTYEWDIEVSSLVVACCARHHRMVTEMIHALDGRHEVAEIAADDEARALLAVFDDLGLLERHAPPAWNGEPRVTWMGHAGVLYEAGGKRLLVDTIAFPRSEPTRHAARPFDLRGLGDLDAVLITHGDNDHLHPGLLYRVPRRTPIVIPSTPEPRPYQVDMRRVLATLGFERIIEVDEWQRLAFGDVTVVAAPFCGEDWGLTLPCRTYVIASPELTVYLNADSTSTPAAYDRIAAEHAIDLAFVGVTGAEETYVMPPRYGYGDFYAPWIPNERRNEWVRLTNGPRDSAEAAVRLGARFAFGYAAGGVPFYHSAYCDRGTHAELAASLAEIDGPTRPLALEAGVPTRVPPCSGPP